MKRQTIFCVQVAWLIALGAAAAVYFLKLPAYGDVRLGPIPIGVVWFGALGAVLISLTGVVEHAHNWDPTYDLWHLSRPLVGAALAVVSVLMLQAGVLAIGAQPAPADQGPPKYLLYYLVAFVVGYREETFRELIKRLVDLLLAPATHSSPPLIASVAPAQAPAAAGGAVKILGSGLGGAMTVMGGSARAPFHVDSDDQITADVPPAAAAGPTSITVKTKDGSATAAFVYTP